MCACAKRLGPRCFGLGWGALGKHKRVARVRGCVTHIVDVLPAKPDLNSLMHTVCVWVHAEKGASRRAQSARVYRAADCVAAHHDHHEQCFESASRVLQVLLSLQTFTLQWFGAGCSLASKALYSLTFSTFWSSMSAVTNRLLSDRQFHIEFHGFLTNHAKHAVVALHGLNAADSKIQHYWDECAPAGLLQRCTLVHAASAA